MMICGERPNRLILEKCGGCGWDGYVRLYESSGRYFWVCPMCISTTAPTQKALLTA